MIIFPSEENHREKGREDNILMSIADNCNPTPAAEVAVWSLYARMKRSPPRMHAICQGAGTISVKMCKNGIDLSLQPPEEAEHTYN